MNDSSTINDEKVDVQFSTNEDNDNENAVEQKPDLSKYTVIEADHLDEDKPIKGQEWCLLSFMSPEGIMNCNVRSVKFRGAFSSLEEANKKVAELEEQDKYFKIFAGESGKWLDFDPPDSHVEEEKSTNPEYQKRLAQQKKQRMDKINNLCGKTKEMVDKKDKGRKERIDESKKASAANDAVDKQRTKKTRESRRKETSETRW